jgi:hypothetical protein
MSILRIFLIAVLMPGIEVASTIAQTAAIDRRVTVQPIQVCSTAGDDCANPGLSIYELATDKIWAQAGIEFHFLPVVQYSNTVYLSVSSDPFAANSVLSLALNPGHGQHSDPTVINLWFVKIIDGSAGVYGFSLQTTARPGSLVERNGVTIADSAFSYAGGAGMLDIFAYEIARNLGLNNSDLGASTDPKNLMKLGGPYPTSINDIYPDGEGYGHLTEQQVERARSTSFAVQVVLEEPPSIAVQPLSQAIATGQTAMLAVFAAGSEPITFQWYAGLTGDTNQPIPGATGPSLATDPLTSDTSFWVRVTNPVGTADSATAVITVLDPPSITLEPADQTVAAGQAATLIASATGSDPLNYQWYRGEAGDVSQPIDNATGPGYTTEPLLQTSLFWLRVSNDIATTNTRTATITVEAVPSTLKILSHDASVITLEITGPARTRWSFEQWFDAGQWQPVDAAADLDADGRAEVEFAIQGTSAVYRAVLTP